MHAQLQNEPHTLNTLRRSSYPMGIGTGGLSKGWQQCQHSWSDVEGQSESLETKTSFAFPLRFNGRLGLLGLPRDGLHSRGV